MIKRTLLIVCALAAPSFVFAAACVDISRPLSAGSRGPDVSLLQEFLRDNAGYTEEITGYFGSYTRSSVGAWQIQNGLVADKTSDGYGLVGPKTRALLSCASAQNPTIEFLKAEVARLVTILETLLQASGVVTQPADNRGAVTVIPEPAPVDGEHLAAEPQPPAETAPSTTTVPPVQVQDNPPQQKTVFRLQEYGAACDGTADDRDAFYRWANAMRASQAPAVTGIISGSCRLNSPVSFYVKEGTTIRGENNATIMCANAAKTTCLNISGGGPFEKTAVTASVPRGATQISVLDAAAFKPGDYVLIDYTDPTVPAAGTIAQGQLNKILSKSGNTLTLENEMSFAVALGAFNNPKLQATAQRVTTTSGVTIRDLVIDGARTTDWPRGFSAMYLNNAVLSNITARNFMNPNATPNTTGEGQQGVLVYACDGCEIRQIVTENISNVGIDFSYLYNATISDIAIRGTFGDGVEFTKNAKSSVTNVSVELDPMSHARVFKTTGSTGNTFTNVTLAGANGRTGLSLASGTSYNVFYNVFSRNASDCVWLNGTWNSFNTFTKVTTRDCYVRPGHPGLNPGPGKSISASATSFFRDVGNIFTDVDTGGAVVNLISADPPNSYTNI